MLTDLTSLVPSWVLVLVVAVLGVVIGSFLNVVIWRVPRGESIVQPPSACPRCGHAIRARDNIPVLSWIVLRGRCRDCGSPIAVRYPAVEVGTGALFGLTTWWLGWSWALPAFLYLAAIALTLALIDLDTRRLPNVIVLPSYPAALALLALGTWNPGGVADWSALVRAVLAGGALFGVYFVLMVIYPAGMGFGDVKLAGVVGLYLGWIGWGTVVVGWFAAFLLGGAFAIGLLIAGRATRKTGIPFGPWILLGAAVGLVAGAPIATWYAGML